MRRSLSSERRWFTAAVVISVALLDAGCTLVQPGCRNRDVTAAIEHEARESIELWMAGSKQTAPSADTRISLADQVEVERHDNTRSCTAHVMVGGGDDAVAVPIDYEVIVGDGGQPFYRWDKDEFGKQFVNTALASLLINMARRQTAPSPPDSPPAEQQPLAWAPTDTASWQREVYAAIFARAKKLTNMPPGAQTMRFRIGPEGEVTMARPVGPIENAELADKLTKFLDAMDHVAKSPSASGTWVQVRFSF